MNTSPLSARGLAAAAGIAVVLATARLGVWQLDRAHQKDALRDRQAQRTQAPPLDLAAAAVRASDAPAQWDRRIAVEGRWLPQAAVLLENRVMNGRAGLLLLMPLQLPDGSAVLVQRGWLPPDPRDRTRVPELPTTAAKVAVAGRIAPVPSPYLTLGAAGVPSKLRQNLDLDAYAVESHLRLRPWTLQQQGVASPAAAAAAGPAEAAEGPAAEQAAALERTLLRDWPAPDFGRDKHIGYAGQWFAMSALAAGLTLWFAWIAPRRRRSPPPP